MSLIPVAEVKCDGPAGAGDCPDSAAWTDYGTARSVRKSMAAAGWLTGRPGGLDLCPKCRSNGT